jgi:hypothetical protein
MSWILEEERLLQIQQNYIREPMDSIRLYFLYINLQSYIEKITYETINLSYYKEKGCSIIPKEQVLQLIQNKRITTNNSKYIFKDSLLYLVDLEPENIQNFSKNNDSNASQFLKVLPPIEDISIYPSIFIFHKLNAIYFIYHEVEYEKKPPLKPILKILDGSNPNPNPNPNPSSKKRVTIKLHNESSGIHHNKTRNRRSKQLQK